MNEENTKKQMILELNLRSYKWLNILNYNYVYFIIIFIMLSKHEFFLTNIYTINLN